MLVVCRVEAVVEVPGAETDVVCRVVTPELVVSRVETVLEVPVAEVDVVCLFVVAEALVVGRVDTDTVVETLGADDVVRLVVVAEFVVDARVEEPTETVVVELAFDTVDGVLELATPLVVAVPLVLGRVVLLTDELEATFVEEVTVRDVVRPVV